MKPTPQELIEKKLPTMPKEIQALFDSEELANKIESISKKNGLSENQTDALFDTVAYTLFGVVSLNSIGSELKTELNIEDKLATSISTELYGAVLSPVKRFLKDDGPTAEKETARGAEKTSTLIDHKDILREIENPTPSIFPAASSVSAPKTAVISASTSFSDTISTLGGFKPVAPSINPASPVATKLDEKLLTPASSAPKEIYQIKKVDPYHEPIEP